MNISDYLRTALLNHVLDVAPFDVPTNVYAGVYTTAPTSAGGGVEVSTGDYARVVTSWSAAVLGSIENLGAIRFPATGLTGSDWSTIVALGLFDSSSGGNLLFFGPLSAAVILDINSFFLLAPASLTISLT